MVITLKHSDLYVIRYYPYCEATSEYYSRLFNALADLDMIYTGITYGSHRHNQLYRYIWGCMNPNDRTYPEFNYLWDFDPTKLYWAWRYYDACSGETSEQSNAVNQHRLDVKFGQFGLVKHDIFENDPLKIKSETPAKKKKATEDLGESAIADWSWVTTTSTIEPQRDEEYY